jgi:riboflavin biosynthesis pyrimidine reductase
MSPESEPAALTPLLGEASQQLSGASQQLSAAEVVERLRLWEQTPAGGRPRVFLNMACTADGRATLGGRSAPLSNPADRELFHALRTAVDAVLVGAGTVRAEGYRRIVRDEAHRQLRRARGLAEEPLACIVSASLTLPDVPLLADPGARPVILTPSPSGELPASAAPVQYLRSARDGVLDLPAALGELHTRFGVRTLLCEGGPHLNSRLFAAGLIDELFLSLAPKLAGGEGIRGGEGRVPGGSAPLESAPGEHLRILCGPELDPPVALELLGALESESQLLLRYRVGGVGGAR